MKKLLFALALMFCATAFMPSESKAHTMNIMEQLESKACQSFVQPASPIASPTEALDKGLGLKIEFLPDGSTVISVYFVNKWTVILVL